MILDAVTLYERMVTDWTPNGLAKLQSMRAVFNLRWDEGEQVQWVLTPYDQKSERLPHAEARSLSMSWVVEPTGESSDGKDVWGTVGVSENVIEASWIALADSLHYKLMREVMAKAEPAAAIQAAASGS